MDDADISQERLEREDAQRRRMKGDQAYEIPQGKAGDCDLCGEWCRRLIGGACARCRDKYRMP